MYKLKLSKLICPSFSKLYDIFPFFGVSIFFSFWITYDLYFSFLSIEANSIACNKEGDKCGNPLIPQVFIVLDLQNEATIWDAHGDEHGNEPGHSVPVRQNLFWTGPLVKVGSFNARQHSRHMITDHVCKHGGAHETSHGGKRTHERKGVIGGPYWVFDPRDRLRLVIDWSPANYLT